MQLNPELKEFIQQVMPQIDKIFTKHGIPIHARFTMAATFFVENYIVDSSLGGPQKILEHETFAKGIVPLFMQWYYETYGDLSTPPYQPYTVGMVTSYAQPIKIKVPLTTFTPTEKDTCWLNIPDEIQKDEKLTDFIDRKVRVDVVDQEMLSKLEKEVSEIVSKTRRININLITVSNLDLETERMMAGIWTHFEKAINDIISFRNERISMGCWELHMAMEKSFKVLIKQKTGKKVFGHDLFSLYKKSKMFCKDLDSETLQSLPSDKDAIQLRYAEQFIHIDKAIEYYKTALNIVCTLTDSLDRKYKLNNAALKIKCAPWAN